MRNPRSPINIQSFIHSFFSHPLTKAFFKKILFIKKPIDAGRFYSECLIFIVLLIWGLSFFDETNFAVDPYGASDSFLHNINLAFHETGHVIFGGFGKFLAVLGGTLMQCLIPIVIMGNFLIRKDNFSASFGLWWLGQNFLDISPYIYDAWDMKLQLIGGGTGREVGGHDWRYLLTTTNNLNNYAEFAGFIGNLGKFILLLSFLWGGTILYKKFILLKSNDSIKQI